MMIKDSIGKIAAAGSPLPARSLDSDPVGSLTVDPEGYLTAVKHLHDTQEILLMKEIKAEIEKINNLLLRIFVVR